MVTVVCVDGSGVCVVTVGVCGDAGVCVVTAGCVW